MNDEPYTTEQLSAYLGRSPQAIRDLVYRREIPYRKPGGRLLFLKHEIERWIEVSGGLSLEQWESMTKQKDKVKKSA